MMNYLFPALLIILCLVLCHGNRNRTKPTFLCIGVQKAGTTSLINYLSQHPNIYMHKSELHFFDNVELTEESMLTYEKKFETHKKIVGEKTPSYNYLQYAMERIYKYNPQMKLILILREPISRSFSQYNMILNFHNKTLDDVTDEQIIKDFEKEENITIPEIHYNGNFYIARGKYDEIILHILSIFPKDQLYIGIAEEIKENKYKYYNEIFEFLGASKLDTMNEDNDVHIREYTKEIPIILERKLYEIYKPHNEKLYEILGRRIEIWETYYDKFKLKIR